MKEYKKVFKFFFAGQEGKECEWLSQMSRKGYHLVNVSFVCFFTFKKGENKDHTYMIDMKESAQVDEDEYLLMYKEHGIEYIDKSADFYYFRGGNDINIKDMIQNEQGRYLNQINSQKKVVLLASLINIIIFVVNSIEAYRMNYEYMSYTPFINLFVGILCLFVYLTMQKKVRKLKEEGIKSPYKTSLKDWPKFWNFTAVIVVLIIIYGFLVLIGH